MRVGSSGFTILEALVAAAVLSVGILALVGSAALTSRMAGQGAASTRAGLTAAARLERLRQVAFSTAPPCTAAEWRSDSASEPGFMVRWELLDLAGTVRRVRLVLDTRHSFGASSDTVLTAFLCGPP
ncbi:MAG: hypothetical protein M3Y40_02980 [Chloroflexota bacterium]|nr:hypothetical protein [Chloroflexota bacterium]